ncbi:hypothetical protein WIS52_02845 [Pseudonocardia nematodicida]|uniref:Uncharacterized protein n=1 Tax=Pseudonocardia nematodicida TaxID=1206997 RepID=A0ABV1K4M7_9PSEU
MPTPHTQHRESTAAASSALTALRVAAVASVVVLAWQFVTAGSLIDGGSIGLHAIGAIVLHVVTGLAALGALWLLVTTRGSVWPTVVAVVVFVLTFVQAYYGGYSTMFIHVPGAMLLTIGALWLAYWSLARHGARP